MSKIKGRQQLASLSLGTAFRNTGEKKKEKKELLCVQCHSGQEGGRTSAKQVCPLLFLQRYYRTGKGPWIVSSPV